MTGCVESAWQHCAPVTANPCSPLVGYGLLVALVFCFAVVPAILLRGRS